LVPVAFVVGRVRDNGLQMGATMDYAWQALIPRLVWPGKPEITRGTWFSVYVGFARSEEGGYSLAQTATGELYLNFGLLGVLFGMWLIGAIDGLTWRSTGLDPRYKPFNMMFYMLLLKSLREMAEAVTTFYSMLAYLMLLKAGLFIFHRWSLLRQRRHSFTGRPAYAQFQHAPSQQF
jgi:hypothetical protein